VDFDKEKEVHPAAQHLFELDLREALRRQGLGSRVLKAAEEEGARRRCTRAILSTLSFQAPGFYQRQGCGCSAASKNSWRPRRRARTHGKCGYWLSPVIKKDYKIKLTLIRDTSGQNLTFDTDQLGLESTQSGHSCCPTASGAICVTPAQAPSRRSPRARTKRPIASPPKDC
jgi:hypothetical protein